MTPHVKGLPSYMTLGPYSNATTSRDAARNLRPKALQHLERVVLDFVRMHYTGGATRQEICDGLALSGDAVRPRVVSLIEKGLLYESEDTRPTPSGREAHILRTTREAL